MGGGYCERLGGEGRRGREERGGKGRGLKRKGSRFPVRIRNAAVAKWFKVYCIQEGVVE